MHACWSIRFEITLWHSEKTIAQVIPAFITDSKQKSYVSTALTRVCARLCTPKKKGPIKWQNFVYAACTCLWFIKKNRYFLIKFRKYIKVIAEPPSFRQCRFRYLNSEAHTSNLALLLGQQDMSPWGSYTPLKWPKVRWGGNVIISNRKFRHFS